MTSDIAVLVEDLTKFYGQRRGIEGLTLEVRTGEVISPVGSYSAVSRVRRDITFLPIVDGPVLRYAPVWRRTGVTPLVRAFLQAAADAPSGDRPRTSDHTS
ncbi:type 2 periplasmic-binding domain-containing protein [Micromonospora chersina]|uniref:hypothetical protein n=1 Tax=Micromonospora chersina TaxID=47854 RepID=UPI00371933DE